MLETLQSWAALPKSFNPWTKHTHPTLHSPRLLCLHGGGTNARIFRSQCRMLRAKLSPYYRLVFAEAPFLTTPGPDVVSVYEKWGPFRSWLPPGFPSHGNPHDGPVPFSESEKACQLVIRSIEGAIESAMSEDDRLGATGDWVGVLGFSQGAKMAASLLLRAQNFPGYESLRRHKTRGRVDYKFAVLLAGRAPMVSLTLDEIDDFGMGMGMGFGLEPATLHLPTVHVHGLRDPGLELHRELLDYGCETGSARVVEWDGEHRVPIRSEEVMAVVDAVVGVGRETGVI
ncbi:serine hydrolase FSH [Aspergillus karnatakaensis]|uniref:serine hydrolase FSH n=1 Tax=Aspergillus karnatakaensis TaxID=1810916 RepID=UPI003CCCFE02